MAFQYVIDNLVGELVKVAKTEADDFDENIQRFELMKVDAIMELGSDKEIDMVVDEVIDVLSETIKNHKINKQFWVAITKRNWKLLKPIREKYRESCDALMEMNESMVEKGNFPESRYISEADGYKENLGYMDAVISRCEGAFRLVL
jgi:hypothetical protein